MSDITPKLKPRWEVHLLGVENQAGSRAGGLEPLIAGWFGSVGRNPKNPTRTPAKRRAGSASPSNGTVRSKITYGRSWRRNKTS